MTMDCMVLIAAGKGSMSSILTDYSIYLHALVLEVIVNSMVLKLLSGNTQFLACITTLYLGQ